MPLPESWSVLCPSTTNFRESGFEFRESAAVETWLRKYHIPKSHIFKRGENMDMCGGSATQRGDSGK
jgi:hypothetical protein